MSGLIALDWGTSSLRAMWMDADGTVVETRRKPWGIRQLPDGGFTAALAAVTDGWPSLPRIASGMVGSRGGWREVAYLDLPAGGEQLAGALDQSQELAIVPGLRNARGPDVMRGEETQLVGLMATDQAAADATVLLPGTHSKWVSLQQGRIIDFCTLMTGELYALLRQHSILAAGIAADAATVDDGAFREGVRHARDSGAAGAFSRLFATRARMLGGELSAGSVPDYLSGLLIGEEFRSMQADRRRRTDRPLWLIGDAALCARYRTAAAEFSIALAPDVDDTAAAGLWWLARAAGLFESTSLPVSSGVSP
jgi:2-dehydro-3-deoxygalactonokinase